jgi:hypothetical protein
MMLKHNMADVVLAEMMAKVYAEDIELNCVPTVVREGYIVSVKWMGAEVEMDVLNQTAFVHWVSPEERESAYAGWGSGQHVDARCCC